MRFDDQIHHQGHHPGHVAGRQVRQFRHPLSQLAVRCLGLDYLYKAFTTRDLAAAIGGVRALGIRCRAVSMPFKEDCIPMVDELDPSVQAIDSVNTIVNTDGYLKTCNTD
ncbi:hypothetical protein [Zobellella sp. An-6]|uniref:hypothetical protein n=1 Tax=Zobellella sp. An-6 TaxID=3400218 RepID=UPI00404119CA